MISVAEAKQLIEQHTVAGPVVYLPLSTAAGLTLAQDIYAPYDIPAFPQSSMDGYAFAFSDWNTDKALQINGEIAAGDATATVLAPQTTVRIFTGAPVPAGADTVIEQEKVRIEQGYLFVEKENLAVGNNVRPKGSEIIADTLALPQNTLLTPAAIGFLAAIGIASVPVFAQPRINIILTGNELQAAGNPLLPGQVYEANGGMLTAALQSIGCTTIHVYSAADDLDTLTAVLKTALENSDMVLLTGGVSVGDYDFVLQAAAQNGVEKIFHKIRQKPGKPLFFGKKDAQLIFGLPGNPASVLTCFYEYVLAALSKQRCQNLQLTVAEVPFSGNYKKNAGMTHFLKGYYDGHTATLLQGQESYRLSSFARSNCLIVIGEAQTEVLTGQLVDIHIF